MVISHLFAFPFVAWLLPEKLTMLKKICQKLQARFIANINLPCQLQYWHQHAGWLLFCFSPYCTAAQGKSTTLFKKQFWIAKWKNNYGQCCWHTGWLLFCFSPCWWQFQIAKHNVPVATPNEKNCHWHKGWLLFWFFPLATAAVLDCKMQSWGKMKKSTYCCMVGQCHLYTGSLLFCCFSLLKVVVQFWIAKCSSHPKNTKKNLWPPKCVAQQPQCCQHTGWLLFCFFLVDSGCVVLDCKMQTQEKTTCPPSVAWWPLMHRLIVILVFSLFALFPGCTAVAGNVGKKSHGEKRNQPAATQHCWLWHWCPDNHLTSPRAK